MTEIRREHAADFGAIETSQNQLKIIIKDKLKLLFQTHLCLDSIGLVPESSYNDEDYYGQPDPIQINELEYWEMDDMTDDVSRALDDVRKFFYASDLMLGVIFGPFHRITITHDSNGVEFHVRTEN